MNEFEKNIEGEDEISRIQREIERDLQSHMNMMASTDMNSIQTERVPIRADYNKEVEKPQDEMGNPSQMEVTPTIAEPMVSLDTIESEIRVDPIFGDRTSKVETSTSAFYQETIKNDTLQKNKTHFRRVVAVVCIVTILGGLFVGIGIGIGAPMIKDYFTQNYNSDNAAKNFSEEAQEESAFAFSNNTKAEKQDTVNNTVETTEDKVLSAELQLPQYNLVNVVNKVEPSVVSITMMDERTQNFMDITKPLTGSGSGIIFFEDEQKVYIATNYHVINGATNVQISIAGSELAPARLVGSDAQSDLSVISVDKEELKKVKIEKVVLADFGDSDKMQVGEMVLAIGNALGEGNTATIGIVSAKDKEINVKETVLSVIQTDAAINPGNSGGPLVNMNGEVIGINTAKLSESSVEGMGYSITSNKAKPIIESLMNKINKPFLGIEGFDITQKMAEIYGLPQMGVYVNSIIDGSSAAAAGIKHTDIITMFNGEAIFTMEKLTELIQECKIGDKVEVKLLRDGKTPMKIDVILTEYKDVNF